MPLGLTATPEVSPNGVPRVRLNLTGITGPTVYVYRTDQDGRTVTVRQAAPAFASGAFVVYDYEAPFDREASYLGVDSANSQATATASPTSGGVAWLVHPGAPELSVPLGVLEWPAWTRPVTRGVFQPLGRKFRVAVSTRRQSVEGSLSLYTAGSAETAALEAVLADGVTLLLKGTATEYAGTRFVSIGDVLQAAQEADLRGFTVWTLPLVEVDSPAGVALAPATYADTSATFFSYAQTQSVAPTYADRSGGTWKA